MARTPFPRHYLSVGAGEVWLLSSESRYSSMISSFFLQAQALAQIRYFADQRCPRHASCGIATNHPQLAVVVHTLPQWFP